MSRSPASPTRLRMRASFVYSLSVSVPSRRAAWMFFSSPALKVRAAMSDLLLELAD